MNVKKHTQLKMATNNERNKNNISTVYEIHECQQLNKSDSEQSSVNISCDSIPYVASENTNTTDSDFKDTLAVWVIEHQALVPLWEHYFRY